MGNFLLVLVVMCPAVLMMIGMIMISGDADAMRKELQTLPAATLTSSRRRSFHTVVTSSESVYNAWQCRVMYYWLQKQRKASMEMEMEMGGFTRILHSGRPDSFMHEIPTFVATPLPEGTDQGYVVLNRPWAMVQWLQQAQIEEE